MKKTVQGTLKMLWLDVRTSVFVMWGIILGVYVLLALLSLRADRVEMNVRVMSPLHIYMFIVAMVGLRETSAYAIGMSVRRTDYYFAVLALASVLSAVFGLAYTAGALVEAAWFDRPDLTFRVFRIGGFESQAFGAA